MFGKRGAVSGFWVMVGVVCRSVHSLSSRLAFNSWHLNTLFSAMLEVEAVQSN